MHFFQYLLLKELTLASTSLKTLVCLHEQQLDFYLILSEIKRHLRSHVTHHFPRKHALVKQENSRLDVHLRKPECQELLSVSFGCCRARTPISLRGVLIKNRFLLGGW